MLLNPYILLGAGAFWLVSVLGIGFASYNHGKFVQEAEYTDHQLNTANATIEEMKRLQNEADKAGEQHDENIKTVTNTTREIIRTVTIPASSDPFLPVGFVRLFDRAASGDKTADPYPGKSDGEPSDVAVSEAAKLLTENFGNVCRANATQLADLITYLKAQNTTP